MSEITDRATAYLRQLAPHAASREAAAIIRALLADAGALPAHWADWVAAAERELRDTADAAREAGDPIAAIDALLDDLDNLRAGRPTWRRVLADHAGDDDALRCLQ